MSVEIRHGAKAEQGPTRKGSLRVTCHQERGETPDPQRFTAGVAGWVTERRNEGPVAEHGDSIDQN